MESSAEGSLENSVKRADLISDKPSEVNPDDPDSNLNNKRTSYYVEENEKLLNLLITNCEPILQETVNLIDHFNSYNGMQKVIDKS